MAIGNENNTIKTRIQLKSDTTENWRQAGLNNFVPLNGELIIYTADGNHPYPRVKVGDGITNINNLNFIEGGTLYGKETEFVKLNNFNERPQPGSPDKLYIDMSTNKIYHYESGGYMLLSNFTLNVEYIQLDKYAGFDQGQYTRLSVDDNILKVKHGALPSLLTSPVTVVKNVELISGGNG